jgi:hypothetical protein
MIFLMDIIIIFIFLKFISILKNGHLVIKINKQKIENLS